MKPITLELRPSDAEPILREAAEHAAKFGGQLDHITRRTCDGPRSIDDDFEDWQARTHGRFLRAKRIVEAFGVEYEQTTEAETLTITWPQKKNTKTRNIGGFRAQDHNPDYANPYPMYQRGVHAEACRQAADRVVRRWRAMLEVPPTITVRDRDNRPVAVVVEEFTLPCVTTREDGSPAFVDDGEFAKGGLRW